MTESTHRKYRGTIVPLVTPVDEHGDVDRPSVARLIGSIRDGVTGLMPCLSTGEGWTMTEPQWRAMITGTVEFADGLPVIAGVPVRDTERAAEWTTIAARLGATAVIVAPPESAAEPGAVLRHYRSVVGSAEVDVFVYNDPADSGVGIELPEMIDICRLPGIAGVKQSNGSTDYTRELTEARLDVSVFEGWEHLLGSCVVDGFIGPLANLDPRLCNLVFDVPSEEHRFRMEESCQLFGLRNERWYSDVKFELHRRGVISTPDLVNERHP